MESQQALLQEFAARKDQVLNLEVRMFVVLLALESLFLAVYVYNLERVRQSLAFSIGAASTYFMLFFILVATNAKMGLVSVYLQQLERYMNTLGYVGVVWESKALGTIIFRIGNAFTLSAGLAAICLLLQSLFVAYLQISHFTDVRSSKVTATLIVGILLLGLTIKSITVDFHYQVPHVFDQYQPSPKESSSVSDER